MSSSSPDYRTLVLVDEARLMLRPALAPDSCSGCCGRRPQAIDAVAEAFDLTNGERTFLLSAGRG